MVTAYPVPTLNEMLAAEMDGKVFRCVKGRFIGFKYTRSTMYSRDWDFCSLNARGIVYDINTGDVVARPFRKFFNHNELFADGKETSLNRNISSVPTFKPDLSGHFRAMDKIDGSLIIVFYDNETKQWEFKTAGWFDTPYAIWAKNWANEHIDFSYMDIGVTYCFEVVAKEFLHPISYDTEELFLLGAVDLVTGVERPIEYLQKIAPMMHVRIPDIIYFNTLDDAIAYAKALPETKEGIVVTYDNGTKLKVKGDAFLERQAFFHDLTPKHLIELFDVNAMSIPQQYIEMIPEEMPELRAQAIEMRNAFTETYERCNKIADQLYTEHNGNAKAIYEVASTLYKNNGLSIILMVCNHKRKQIPYDSILRNMIAEYLWGKV